jgi:hypothetical protein
MISTITASQLATGMFNDSSAAMLVFTVSKSSRSIVLDVLRMGAAFKIAKTWSSTIKRVFLKRSSSASHAIV